MNDLDDASLVARARAGETAAFGELVSRYESSARVAALRYVHNHHSAEDVAQQAFVRAFGQLETLRDHSKFSAWLIRIVQREAARFGGRNDRSTVDLTAANEAHSACAGDRLGEELQEAAQLLNLLPEHERIVMSLHYLDGRSTTEIAHMIGRPLGTVTKQLSRATKRIQSLAQRRERKT